MISPDQAHKLADDWMKAWNDHDLEAILSHYAEDIEFQSPFAVQILGRADGLIQGKKDLKAYFTAALQKYPALHFEPYHVILGVESLVLHYRSVNNLRAAEVMTLNGAGKIQKVLAHYLSEV